MFIQDTVGSRERDHLHTAAATLPSSSVSQMILVSGVRKRKRAAALSLSLFFKEKKK
jgi:hypothetical protein